MGGGLCTLCHAHGARGLAYAAVFMALQTHSELPHGICLAGYVCARTRVREHYEGCWVGWGGVEGGAFPFALRLALFRHFQLEGVVSLETDLNFKPISGRRETEGWVTEWGGSQRRFQELLGSRPTVVMLQSGRGLYVSTYCPKNEI